MQELVPLDVTSPVSALLTTHFAHAPTPYHTVAYLAQLASQVGFVELDESDPWAVSPGDKVIIRRDGSVCFVVLGTEPLPETGVRVIGAHTDSPTFKVRPNAMRTAGPMQLLNVETYGGPIAESWFDRDLTVAGRVMLADGSSRLVCVSYPCTRIAHLAIHLRDRSGSATDYNPQTKARPIWGMADDPTLLEVIAKEEGINAAHIVSHDLTLIPTEAPVITGAGQRFFSSWRQDDLLGTVTAFHALLNAIENEPETPYSRVVICYDFEEIGSETNTGAGGSFLDACLSRLVAVQGGKTEDVYRCVAKSGLVSLDVAHGWHPNYADRYDDTEYPVLGGGPCLKVNANQSYATTGLTAAWAHLAAKRAGVPLQTFTSRADQRCGSTIGPITATRVGIATVDVGQPIIGMHSVRELSHLDDADTTTTFLAACLNTADLPFV